ncbi:hypothetical protein JL193_09505 [Polaribacter batillariae]|uniref:Lipoprotein n=1 Tax=Polaribacter batillariae TaxID=2808900 RepID=A0ABX7SQA1_9FLAO|nr:hypothetical protein [Polaribacter batillariae]QTD36395.1 hypothetical protein JL193_09505 [Polaribacter batillariae]
MDYKTKTLVFLTIVLLLNSCSCRKAYRFTGERWTFIKNDKQNIDYSEIEFSDKIINIYSENSGKMGPFKYQISDNKLIFNNQEFNINSVNNQYLILENNSAKYYMYKIPFKEDDIQKNQLNPFYIRRCYFLTHLNFIKVKDAIEYIGKLREVPKDSILEEEIMLNN